MFIPEMTCFLTVSNRLGHSFVNLKYCLLLKYASDRLELSISVYIYTKNWHQPTGGDQINLYKLGRGSPKAYLCQIISKSVL